MSEQMICKKRSVLGNKVILERMRNRFVEEQLIKIVTKIEALLKIETFQNLSGMVSFYSPTRSLISTAIREAVSFLLKASPIIT